MLRSMIIMSSALRCSPKEPVDTALVPALELHPTVRIGLFDRYHCCAIMARHDLFQVRYQAAAVVSSLTGYILD